MFSGVISLSIEKRPYPAALTGYMTISPVSLRISTLSSTSRCTASIIDDGIGIDSLVPHFLMTERIEFPFSKVCN